MATKGVAGLNIYKKLAIIRKADDVLSYEDGDGNVKTVTDLHLAAKVTTPLLKTKPKEDIPVPKIRDVETYKTDIQPDYKCPIAFVRHQKPSTQELHDNLEYVIDAEDEVWLHNNSKFGSASKNSQSGEEKKTTILPLIMLETMLDIMEKATAFEAIITKDQAENLILKRIPQLYRMYPVKARAGVVSLKHVLTDVYNYWMSKRSKLKRPLLRRFWPVTASDDTNPHLVFRPREKEKYKLRKKRQNDMDAYKKLEQLKHDFAQVRRLCKMVKQREQLNKHLILLQGEWFRQKLYEAIDTSGQPRASRNIDMEKLNALMKVERHYDVDDGHKKKKARRGSQFGKSNSRSASPVPEMGVGAASMETGTTSASGDSSSEVARKPMVIAGQNHGEPAPNFLNPLYTRERYTTSWEGVPPHVTSYVDATPVPTFRFRHRPRVGRGGRLCIDRMPLPIDPNIPAQTFFRAGNSLSQPREPKRRLLDLRPPPLDRNLLRQKIEDISLEALQEDYDPVPSGFSGQEGDENDGDVVLVRTKEWLNTDDQLWGEERYSIGPI